jgi:hypothetical protein
MYKPLTDTLRMLQGGALNDHAGELLADIVKGVDETGRAGRLTITIDVKKAGAAVSVRIKVTDKTPEEQADDDLFWPTVEGNLSLQNPNQRSLDLQPLPKPRTELRPAPNVDPDTGEISAAG